MEENIELKRIFDIMLRKKLLIIIILLIFTILGYVYSFYYITPKYKSETTLLLIPNSIDKVTATTDLNMNSQLITTYSNIALNYKVLEQVINNLQLDISKEELQKQVESKVIKDTYIIQLTVKNEDAKKAMEITKELANVFLAEIKQIYNLENIGIVDEAEIEQVPYNINHIKDIAIFIIIGIGIISLYTMIVYTFDNTIKNQEEIEKYVKIKSLGSIPIYTNKKQEIIDRSNEKSYITECINTIRTNILYMNTAKKAKTILITSSTPREGKSWVSSNIATAFADTNKKVLLIDTDMRKGRTNKIFNLNNQKGLSDYLYSITGNIEEDARKAKNYIQETNTPNQHIITNGTTPPNPSEILDSPKMKELITIVKEMYDIIILDAPPCKLVTDSIVLSTFIDSSILVANSGKTKMKDIIEVKNSIEAVGGEIIGAIVNKTQISKKIYEKRYYYGSDNKKHKINKKFKKHKKHKELEAPKEIIENKKLPKDLKPKRIYHPEELIEEAIIKLKEKETKKQEKETKKQQIEEIKENEKTPEIIQIQREEITNIINEENEKIKQDNEKIKQENKIIKQENATIKQENKKMQELIEKQNTYLQEISNSITDIKTNIQTTIQENQQKQQQANEHQEKLIEEKLTKLDQTKQLEDLQNQIKNLNYSDKIADLETQLQSLDYADKITGLETQLQSLDYADKIVGLQNQIENIDYTAQIEDLRNQLQNLNYADKITDLQNQLQNINYADKITDLQTQLQNLNYTEKIVDLQNQIQNLDYTDKIAEIQQQINKLNNIEQINEAITMLKDNYLELLNIIKENKIEEEINDYNIIDLKTFRKENQKKEQLKEKDSKEPQTTFSIKEDISYKELEKTAYCIIPLQNANKQEKNIKKRYEGTM